MEHAQTFDAALDNERARTAIGVGLIRIAIAAAGIASAWLVGRPTEILFVLAFYFGASASLFAAMKASARLLRHAWFAVPLLDIPVALVLRWQYVSIEPRPDIQIGMTVGVLLLLVIVAHASLRPAIILAAFAIALTLSTWLMASAAALTEIGQTVIVLSCGAGILAYTTRRTLVTLQELARHQLQRERLMRYFSPTIAARLALKSGVTVGERREITVLFADLRGFTAISERLSPESVVALLNEYHRSMVTVLFAHGGTLDKFTGDGFMAYFGAPEPNADHARDAVTCALAMQDALRRLNTERAQRADVLLAMGIGLHSGLAVVGDVGFERRLEYTAVGDTVNVSARIETLTKHLNVPVLATAATRALTDDRFAWTPMPATRIRGRREPLITYAPTGAVVQNTEAKSIALTSE